MQTETEVQTVENETPAVVAAETATTETKKKRDAHKSDKVVISAWQEVALSGSPDACIDLAAEKAGMVKESYQQRINKIRRTIKDKNAATLKEWEAACEVAAENGEELPEKPQVFNLATMPQKKRGNRRKTASTFLDVLATVNAELKAKNADEDDETTED